MKDLMNVKAAAEYLGFHEYTVYRWVREGTIPSLRVGKSIRFDKAELDAWVRGK